MTRTKIILTAAVIGLALTVWAAPARGDGSLFVPRVEYHLTADILGLVQGDYQIEFTSVIAPRTAWAARVGYVRHRQGSAQLYDDGGRRWEIGFRWRAFFLQDAPHWLFLGVGWNNRPQDTQITPLAELGFSLYVKPFAVTALGFYGYEFYLKTRAGLQSMWVKGIELRAGLAF